MCGCLTAGRGCDIWRRCLARLPKPGEGYVRGFSACRDPELSTLSVAACLLRLRESKLLSSSSVPAHSPYDQESGRLHPSGKLDDYDGSGDRHAAPL